MLPSVTQILEAYYLPALQRTLDGRSDLYFFRDLDLRPVCGPPTPRCRDYICVGYDGECYCDLLPWHDGMHSEDIGGRRVWWA